jgi:transposase
MIVEVIETTPHLTCEKLASLLGEHGVAISRNGVWLYLRRRGYSFKKTLYGLEQLRPDIARRRTRWRKLLPLLDPDRLVFIDETWIKTNMAPLGGWGARGQKQVGHSPHGHWRTMTFVAALTTASVQAPCVFDGPINGLCFRAWVELFLVPTLRPGQIVVMDNLGSHKAQAIRTAIKSAGARLLFLPPYSPDLNPIEQTFSKIKHCMRTAQNRTLEAIHQSLSKLVQSISTPECQKYIKAVGYGSTKR